MDFYLLEYSCGHIVAASSLIYLLLEALKKMVLVVNPSIYFKNFTSGLIGSCGTVMQMKIGMK